MAFFTAGNLLVKLGLEDKKFRKQMGRVQRDLTRFASPRGPIGGIATGLSSMSLAAGAAAAAIGGITVAMTKMAKRGGEVINIQRAFGRVVGNSDAAVAQLRKSTQGLISDYELMKGFNRAVALGSARNTQEFGQLAEAAIALGRALGVEAGFALESLNLGIGRQSRLILDNLGLIVSVEAANKRYAAALGIATKELTEAQKREAFRTAALESAREKVEALGGVTLNAADQLQQLNVRLQNQKDLLSVSVLPIWADFLQVLTDIGVALRVFGGEPNPLGEFNFKTLETATIALRMAGEELARVQAQGGRTGIVDVGLGAAVPVDDTRRLFEIERLKSDIAAITKLLPGLSRVKNEIAAINMAARRPTVGAIPVRGLVSPIFATEGERRRVAARARRATLAGGGVTTGADQLSMVTGFIIPPPEKVKAATDAVSEAAQEGMSDMAKDLRRLSINVGQQVIFGIIDGVQSVEDLLKNILKAVVSLIISQLTSGLSIFSPSQEMVKLGQQISRGLALGIDLDSPMVAAASARMGSAAIMGAIPSSTSVNVSLPPSASPFDTARDAVWQRTLSETLRELEGAGFRLSFG